MAEPSAESFHSAVGATNVSTTTNAVVDVGVADEAAGGDGDEVAEVVDHRWLQRPTVGVEAAHGVAGVGTRGDEQGAAGDGQTA